MLTTYLLSYLISAYTPIQHPQDRLPQLYSCHVNTCQPSPVILERLQFPCWAMQDPVLIFEVMNEGGKKLQEGKHNLTRTPLQVRSLHCLQQGKVTLFYKGIGSCLFLSRRVQRNLGVHGSLIPIPKCPHLRFQTCILPQRDLTLI